MDDDADIPDDGAVFTFGKSRFADNVPNKFWIKSDSIKTVSCGDEHTALIAGTGRLFTFGSNNWGQLGLGHKNVRNKPSCIKSLKQDRCKLVACGRTHTLVATESHKVYSFGCNSEGQLGVEVDDGEDHTKPHLIQALSGVHIQQLAAGTDHSAALTADGKLYMWGGNEHGQLGFISHEEHVCCPTLIPGHSRITSVSCGYYHTAFVLENGHVYTFGESEGGKLGMDNDGKLVKQPKLVESLKEMKVVGVSCGGNHTLVVTDRGEVLSFGVGSSGQLGLGTTVLNTCQSRLIDRFKRRKASKVTCGESHSAVVTEKGQLYTFGDGRHGKLGLEQENSTSNHFKPVLVKRFAKFNVTDVACGGCHMIVLANKMPDDDTAVTDPAVDEVPVSKANTNAEEVQTANDDGGGDVDVENGIAERRDSLELNKTAREKRREKEVNQPSVPRTLPPLKLTKKSDRKAKNPLDKSKLPDITDEKTKSEEVVTLANGVTKTSEKDEEHENKDAAADIDGDDDGDADGDNDDDDDDDIDDDDDDDDDEDDEDEEEEEEEEEEKEEEKTKKQKGIKSEKAVLSKGKTTAPEKKTQEEQKKVDRPKTSKGIRSFFSRTFSKEAKKTTKDENENKQAAPKAEGDKGKKKEEKKRGKEKENQSVDVIRETEEEENDEEDEDEDDDDDDEDEEGKDGNNESEVEKILTKEGKDKEEKKADKREDEKIEISEKQVVEKKADNDGKKDDKRDDKKKKKGVEVKKENDRKELKQNGKQGNGELEESEVEGDGEEDDDQDDDEDDEDDDEDDDDDEDEDDDDDVQITNAKKKNVKPQEKGKAKQDKGNSKIDNAVVKKKQDTAKVVAQDSFISRVACRPSRGRAPQKNNILSTDKKKETGKDVPKISEDSKNGVNAGGKPVKVPENYKKNTAKNEDDTLEGTTEIINGHGTNDVKTRKKKKKGGKKNKHEVSDDERVDGQAVVATEGKSKQSKTCVVQ